MEMHQYNNALIHYKQSHEIYKNSSLNPRKDVDVAMSVNNIGQCLIKVHQCDDALIYLKQALEIKKIFHLIQKMIVTLQLLSITLEAV